MVCRVTMIKRYHELQGHVVKIDTTTKLQQDISNAKTSNEQRDIVFRYIMDNLRGKYNASDGREVVISSKTAKKYTNQANELKLRVAPKLAELLNKSELVDIVEVKHKIFNKFAYYETIFKVDSKTYVGVINVGIFPNGDALLYELNQIKNT